MIVSEDITIIMNHVADNSYTDYCLRTVKSLEIFKGTKIYLNGYNCLYNGLEFVNKKFSHSLCHGESIYNILKTIPTKYALIMDADFFCTDNVFWGDCLKLLDKKKLVSISRKWQLLKRVPSTPFMLLDKDYAVELVPEKKLWNIFSHNWPLKYYMFDNMQFLFLIMHYLNSSVCIDSWFPLNERKYKFFHFWDMRDSVDRNINDFINNRLDIYNRYQYLAYALNKRSFEYIIGKSSYEQFIDVYCYACDLKEKAGKSKDFYYQYSIIYDFVKNFSNSAVLSAEERERFQTVKNLFYQKYSLSSDILEVL